MKKILLALTIAMVLGVSCKSNYFDQEEYEEYVHLGFPVDSIDPAQDWTTVETAAATVSVSLGTGGSYTAEVYGDNPTTATAATLYGSEQVSDGASVTLNIPHPTSIGQFFVALKGSDGQILVKQATLSDDALTASFTSADSDWASQTATASRFTWRCCFEDAFPDAGDYDFNDLVLTLSCYRESEKCVCLTVSLDAIGSISTISAAARLVGIDATDVDSVTATSLFLQYPYSYMPISTSDATNGFQKSKSDEVVIPFFDDAHYAMSEGATASDGSIARGYVNTVGTTSDSKYSAYAVEAAPVAKTYRIWCKTAATAKSIGHATIDVFTITQYNGSYFETHCFPYKREETLCTWHDDSSSEVYADNYPWALNLPGYFKYPCEGIRISYYYNNVITGAYPVAFHSFGEWAEDHTKATDWYDHPSSNYVYQ